MAIDEDFNYFIFDGKIYIITKKCDGGGINN
jgi:hypothetical protein